jgi:chitinase
LLRSSQALALIGSKLVSCLVKAMTRGVVICVASMFSVSLQAGPQAPAVRGVYVPMWEGVGALASLPAGRVNHVLLAFLRLCGPHQLAKDNQVCAGRGDFELTAGATERAFDLALAQRKRSEPHLVALMSVGGWGGSDGFFAMASSAANRAAFVRSAMRFLQQHPAIDGLDIDWEHPGGNGAANGVALGSAEDGANFVALLADLRAAFYVLGRERGRRVLLTAAVNVTQPVLRRIDWRAAAPLLDRVFMMSYDYHGGWTPRTGHHAALRSGVPPADDSLQESVAALRAQGVPANKLVAGVAFYGRAWRGVARPRAGEPASGTALSDDGSITWRALNACCLRLDGSARAGYQRVWDAQRAAHLLWHPQQRVLISYESVEAVRAKRRWALSQGLGGLFAWEWTQDDGRLLDAMVGTTR